MHVLIVDDHAFVCVGLKATLSSKSLMVLTGNHHQIMVIQCANHSGARTALDLAIVDLFMPGGAGGFNFY